MLVNTEIITNGVNNIQAGLVYILRKKTVCDGFICVLLSDSSLVMLLSGFRSKRKYIIPSLSLWNCFIRLFLLVPLEKNTDILFQTSRSILRHGKNKMLHSISLYLELNHVAKHVSIEPLLNISISFMYLFAFAFLQALWLERCQ